MRLMRPELARPRSGRLRLYPPPHPVVVPILYEEGVSIFLIINTKGDIYLLRINAIGSKERA